MGNDDLERAALETEDGLRALTIRSLASLAGKPIPRLPFEEHPAFTVTRCGEFPEDTDTVYIFRDVLEELRYRAHFESERAMGCILTGGWYLGPDGNYIEIDGFRDSLAAPTAHDLMNFLRSNREQAVSPCVGFFHSRAGSEAKIGPDELLLANTFFAKPWHVMVLIDPIYDRAGFFQRNRGGRFVNIPVRIVSENQPTVDTPLAE